VEEYFTAGLIHDIGKIPLNAILSKDYMLTVSTADRERIPLFQAEKNALGLGHCDAGAMIAKAWKLDGAVGDAIIHHHNYEEYAEGHKDIIYTIAAANRFSSLMGIGFSGNLHPAPLPASVWEALNVSPDVFDEIESCVSSEIENAEIFLKIVHS
jgi:HD-like signal output (HDOD) protein